MCEPATIIGLASLAVSAYGTDQQQKSQARNLTRTAENQAEEAGFEAQQEAGTRVAQARREQARIQVAAGEAGVGGASLRAQLNSNAAGANRDLSVIARQTGFNSRANNDRIQGAAAQFVNPGLNAVAGGLQVVANDGRITGSGKPSSQD